MSSLGQSDERVRLAQAAQASVAMSDARREACAALVEEMKRSWREKGEEGEEEEEGTNHHEKNLDPRDHPREDDFWCDVDDEETCDVTYADFDGTGLGLRHHRRRYTERELEILEQIRALETSKRGGGAISSEEINLLYDQLDEEMNRERVRRGGKPRPQDDPDNDEYWTDDEEGEKRVRARVG